MKNGRFDQFLDTGWHNDSTLFYHGFVYWCDAVCEEDGTIMFILQRWKAECDGTEYHQYVTADNNLVQFEQLLKIIDKDADSIKRKFLTSPVFDGLTFWDVEAELIWVDEGTNLPWTQQQPSDDNIC